MSCSYNTLLYNIHCYSLTLLHFFYTSSYTFYTSLTEAIQAAPLSIAQEVLHAASVIIRACSGVIIHYLHFSYTSLAVVTQEAPQYTAQEVHHEASVITTEYLAIIIHLYTSSYTSLTEEIQAAPQYTALEVHHAVSVIIRACSGVTTVCALTLVMRMMMGTVVSVHFYTSPTLLHFSYTSALLAHFFTLLHSFYTSKLLLHFYTHPPTFLHFSYSSTPLLHSYYTSILLIHSYCTSTLNMPFLH